MKLDLIRHVLGGCKGGGSPEHSWELRRFVTNDGLQGYAVLDNGKVVTSVITLAEAEEALEHQIDKHKCMNRDALVVETSRQ